MLKPFFEVVIALTSQQAISANAENLNKALKAVTTSVFARLRLVKSHYIQRNVFARVRKCRQIKVGTNRNIIQYQALKHIPSAIFDEMNPFDKVVENSRLSVWQISQIQNLKISRTYLVAR